MNVPSVDVYFGRQYLPGSYNCLHFAVDVWRDLTGQDMGAKLDALLTGTLRDREIRRAHWKTFEVLSAPVDPCLVLFQNPKSTPHMGVWLRGRVLHISRREGVRFVPLASASLGYARVRYLKPTP